MSANTTLAELRQSIRQDDLEHDPWGTAMGWGFAVAITLDALGESIPDEWGYRRAPGDTRDLEEIAGDPDAEESDESLDYPDADVALMALSDDFDAEALMFWGRVLHRYLDLCKRKGKDY